MVVRSNTIMQILLSEVEIYGDDNLLEGILIWKLKMSVVELILLVGFQVLLQPQRCHGRFFY